MTRYLASDPSELRLAVSAGVRGAPPFVPIHGIWIEDAVSGASVARVR